MHDLPTGYETAKKEAFSQFSRRVKAANEATKIKKKAGQPCFFYCEACGIFIEKLPEDYLFPPRKLCSQCRGLESEGLLQEVSSQLVKKRS